MNRRSFRVNILVFVLAVVCLLSSNTLIPTQAHADVVQPYECLPAVLMLKGSGEGELDGVPVAPREYRPQNVSSGAPFISTNGHEGQTLRRLLQSFVDRTDPAETVSRVRFIGIEYPAWPVFPNMVAGSSTLAPIVWLNHIINYDQSYRKGAQMTVDFIKEDQKRGCETQYMLLSYSQGVISARLAMNLMNNENDKIISSYVMGDPFQKADGLISSSQFTVANSSPSTEGIGRIASNSVVSISAALGFVNPSMIPTLQGTVDSIASYTQEITRADDFIYQDSSLEGLSSRSLCHEKDPTCSFAGLSTDFGQHLNYFDALKLAGAVDNHWEVPEFDKQVQALANSATSNPRERALVKTPSVIGKMTTYNVANSRFDDLCSWDENSDGSMEATDVPCDTYSIVHSSLSPKMTVKVTDSFGIEHTYTSESDSIDPDSIKILTELDSNTWYQFRPHDRSNKCIAAGWDAATPIDSSSLYAGNLNSMDCRNPATAGSEMVDSWQVFKPSQFTTSDGSKTRMQWGYDDDYSLAFNSSTSFMTLSPTSEAENQNWTPKLTEVENGIPYYSITNGTHCVKHLFYYSPIFTEQCNPQDTGQLFAAIPVDSDFGSFSLEKDITPPFDVTGLNVIWSSEQSVFLVWNASSDNRVQYVEYLVFERNIDGTRTLLARVVEPQYIVDLSGTDELSHTYEVVAVDYKGNLSNPVQTSVGATP